MCKPKAISPERPTSRGWEHRRTATVWHALPPQPSAPPICISNPVPGHQAPSCHLCPVDTSKNNSADTSMALSQKETLKDLTNIIQPVTAGLQTPVCPYPAGVGRTRAASARCHLLWCMLQPEMCVWLHPGKSGSQRVRHSLIF